jgi:hypothetical protein
MRHAIPADIDVFHDREERVASAAINDAKALEAGGYSVRWLRQLPLIYTAEVTRLDASTRLDGSLTAISASSRQCGMRLSATFCTRLTLR